MTSIVKQVLEEEPAPEENARKDIEIKMLSHSETKSLQDAVRVRYKKAFEKLSSDSF